MTSNLATCEASSRVRFRDGKRGGLPADQADQRDNDRAADPADNGEEGSDPEPDMGLDQNKDA